MCNTFHVTNKKNGGCWSVRLKKGENPPRGSFLIKHDGEVILQKRIDFDPITVILLLLFKWHNSDKLIVSQKLLEELFVFIGTDIIEKDEEGVVAKLLEPNRKIKVVLIQTE